jgi:hypothetical protein
MPTSFQPSTKCAYREGSDNLLFSLRAPSENEVRRFISKQCWHRDNLNPWKSPKWVIDYLATSTFVPFSVLGS